MAFQRVDNALHGMNNGVVQVSQCLGTGVTVPRNGCRSASAQVVQSLRTTSFKHLKQVVQSL